MTYPRSRYAAMVILAVSLAFGADAGIKRLRIEKGTTIQPSAAKVETLKVRKLSPPIQDVKIVETKKGEKRLIEIVAQEPEAKSLKVKKSKAKLLKPKKQKRLKAKAPADEEVGL